jgi:acetyl esterase/lipase
MSLKIQPQKIVVTGDSGGAAILLETMLQTYAPDVLSSNATSTADNNTKVTENSGKKLPAAMLLVSPVVCAEIKSPAWKENAKYDIVGPKLFRKVFKEYFGTTDPHAARL